MASQIIIVLPRQMLNLAQDIFTFVLTRDSKRLPRVYRHFLSGHATICVEINPNQCYEM